MSNPFAFFTTKFFTVAISSSLGRVWPPIPPMSALMALSVIRILTQAHDFRFNTFPMPRHVRGHADVWRDANYVLRDSVFYNKHGRNTNKAHEAFKHYE